MKYVIVDFRIDSCEEMNLLNLGYKLIKCPKCPILYDAVCGHPDMLVHLISDNKIIVHKDMQQDFIKIFKDLNFEIIKSQTSLNQKYPYDILLNAVNLKDIFIHKTANTDDQLKKFINNKKIIDVKQGYTKCSTAVVSNNALITSDSSIVKALKDINIDILVVPPGDILLPGLDYGFIGGTCGLLDSSHLAFYGDLNYYKYGNEIIDFLNKHNVKPVYLRKGKLIDRGSLFSISKD